MKQIHLLNCLVITTILESINEILQYFTKVVDLKQQFGTILTKEIQTKMVTIVLFVIIATKNGNEENLLQWKHT